MNAALPASRDSLLPRPPDGLGRGAVLALLVHLLLVAALAFGVNWHAHEPEGVVAELWSAVPQAAAPRATSPPPTAPPNPAPEPAATPVQPPPPPPEAKRAVPIPKVAPEAPHVADAQIAIDKARREEARREAAEREELQRKEQKREAQKEEAQKQEAKELEARKIEAQREKAQREKALAEETKRKEERREQAAKEAEERKQKELAEKAHKEEAAVAARREANLKRIQGQAGATGDAGSTGSAARSSGPSAGYAGRIRAVIKPNIVFAESVSGNPVATVEVHCAADGKIVSRKLVKSSGNSAWDDSVLRAIDRTATLPRDVDGSVPAVLQIDFKPRD